MKDVMEAMETLIDLFNEYSGEDDLLSTTELEKLVEEGLKGSDLEDKLDMAEVTEVFGQLDKNADNQLDFQEFIKCIGLLATKSRKKRGGRRGGKGGKGGRGGKGGKGKGGRRGGHGKGSDDEDDE
ncbi:protein S100-A6-like [Entelurus aequoreus]|uniref:protein S100-A6-like n=1 Tax=Entelurus aequoreus TaxID=161455 RepID=UPI002B1E63E9|nr:protein S100-A6-like [Entelurus aequoreus]